MKIVSQFALVFITLLLTTSAAPAREQALLTEALNQYKERDNLAAYNSFRKVLLKNPDDGLARYYLANILVRLGRMNEAISQYQCASWLSTDATIRGYCLAALQSAGVTPTIANAPQIRTAPPNFASSPANMSGAARAIDYQVSLEASRMQYADNMAQNMANYNVNYAAQVESHAKAVLDSQSFRGSKSTFVTPEAQAYYAWEMRRAGNIRALANEWNLNQQRLDTARSFSFQQSADFIKQQLNDWHPNPNFHMVAQGTSLYVRNYQSQPAPQPVPLVAVPKSLTPISADRANAGRLPVPPSSSDLNGQKKVRGLLLDPRHRMEVSD